MIVCFKPLALHGVTNLNKRHGRASFTRSDPMMADPSNSIDDYEKVLFP